MLYLYHIIIVNYGKNILQIFRPYSQRYTEHRQKKKAQKTVQSSNIGRYNDSDNILYYTIYNLNV